MSAKKKKYVWNRPMISLFLVSTPTLIRWLRLGGWDFLLQNPPSLYSPLNTHNPTPILKSLWTTPYYLLKKFPIHWEYHTFNPHFNFNVHVKSSVTPALLRINILKTPTETKWGQQNETIFITYMSLNRSFSMHVVSILFPNTSPTIHYSRAPNYPKLCPPHSHRLH